MADASKRPRPPEPWLPLLRQNETGASADGMLVQQGSVLAELLSATWLGRA